MVCIDSDIIIDFLRKKEYALKKMKELQNKGETLSTTSINTFELFRGFVSAKKEPEIFALFISNLKVYNFNVISSKKAAEIYEYLKEKGEMLDLGDILIAAIAIVNNEILLTNNTSHFKRIPELKLEEV